MVDLRDAGQVGVFVDEDMTIAAHLKCVGIANTDQIDKIPCDKPAHYIANGYSVCRDCLEVILNG